MSNTIFPSLPGESIDIARAPGFSTKFQRAVSGKEARAAFMAYPLWTLALKFDFLRAGIEKELQTIEGMFLQMRGAWDSFLIEAPTDSAVSDMLFGAGDGARKIFQLTRTRGAGGYGFTEPCENIKSIASIKINGDLVSTSDYSIDGTGRVNFVTAPSISDDLSWSGQFYYRVRFSNDEAQFEQFLHDLWKTGKIEMVGAPGNKV